MYRVVIGETYDDGAVYMYPISDLTAEAKTLEDLVESGDAILLVRGSEDACAILDVNPDEIVIVE